MQEHTKIYTIHWVMYHTVHCDEQKYNKIIKAANHAEHVKRLDHLIVYNSRLNEQRQLKSSIPLMPN